MTWLARDLHSLDLALALLLLRQAKPTVFKPSIQLVLLFFETSGIKNYFQPLGLRWAIGAFKRGWFGTLLGFWFVIGSNVLS